MISFSHILLHKISTLKSLTPNIIDILRGILLIFCSFIKLINKLNTREDLVEKEVYRERSFKSRKEIYGLVIENYGFSVSFILECYRSEMQFICI